eukprot:CAMPEP_0197703992 /NCGR_PEP_ID=MMETSP1338-20131121/125717_1 /TAXON_ID=43686 ORGANISM="Pelagodinium beii, Strain RCC1491" /NCGR_SAMPLE_ID=MMETSP1338 /ASSEMBLY_ACC=CAM_ASM_000754 /LENGTH=592 /DNA_ID=CAMNT_0043287891 /DNA_START=61 /DNA_END=1840 /DNA_ORIENTATION=+
MALKWVVLFLSLSHSCAEDAFKELQGDILALRSALAAQQEIIKEQREWMESVVRAPRSLQTAAELAPQVTALNERVASLAGALDSCWLLLCGSLVMFMHAGFAMLETGCCRAKNAQNVLMKNLVNVCVGTLGWWIFGWAFAYGGSDVNGFIGTEGFAGSGFNAYQGSALGPDLSEGQSIQLSWFFQWAFCTAAATIVSGGVAERVKSPTYAAYAFLMASFIYPVVVAWTWGYGWLSTVLDVGTMDFAGSGIVHLTGGVSALAGTAVLGPRKGRFEKPDEFEAHNLPLVVLGTFALWFGWYGFNPGSTLGMSDKETGALAAQVAMNTTLAAATGGISVFLLRYAIVFGWYGFNPGSTLGMSDKETGALAAQVAMNTTLAAATGGISVFLLRYAIVRKYDVGGLCNGILAGLVSITAGCGNVESGSAVAIGLLGAFVYQGASMLLVKLQIDDPVDASPVHGACGIWGVLAAGLFDWGEGLDHFNGWSGWSCMQDGDGNCQTGIGGTAIAAQLILVISVVAWAGTLSGLAFFALKKTGMLRIDESTEDAGMDFRQHSPPKAYALSSEPAQSSETPVSERKPSKESNSSFSRYNSH